MWYLYLIENEKKKIYIGISKDPKKRVKSHNREKGPDWTQGKGPWTIIHTEEFESQSKALKREKYVKQLKAGQRIKRILNICQGSSAG